MKICAAQTKPIKGDIKANIINHKKLINLAATNGAGIVVFPELSLTGYEPTLAKELATDLTDKRFDDFQHISDTKKIIIGAGMPLKNKDGISISMILFLPHQPRQVYSKKYLHADEQPFFISGQTSIDLLDKSIAVAICYEISIPEHASAAFKKGAGIYVASVAKTVTGVDKAVESLSAIAAKYSMTAVMSNCIGYCDNFDCGGKTSAWNNKGALMAQLNDANEGILIIDTDTHETVTRTI